MALLEDLQALQPQQPVCAIARILDSLVAKDRAALEMALADRSIKMTPLNRALRQNGYQLRDGAITDHRAGKCTCAR